MGQLEVMKVLYNSPERLTAKEISQKTKITYNSVIHLLQAMRRYGDVEWTAEFGNKVNFRYFYWLNKQQKEDYKNGYSRKSS